MAKRGDSIEIGLFITPASSKKESTTPDAVFDANSSLNWPLRCTFDISHKSCSPDAGEDSPLLSRIQPMVQSLLLQRLLRHLGATLAPDMQPSGRLWELSVTWDRGSPSTTFPPPIVSPADGGFSMSSDARIADEPTLEELTVFAESLRGKKATLFASPKGSFAQHLTSYLTAWGLDVSHVSREVEVEGNGNHAGTPPVTEPKDDPALKPLASGYGSGNAPPGTSSATLEGPSQHHRSPSFQLIDDDVTVLRERLHAIQAEQPHPFHLTLRRQSMAASHRSRMSPQGYRSPVHTRSFDTPPPVFIMHFTSLANFKSVKDIVHSFLTLHTGSSPLPEVMIIPKPAGPRRFLTALHTAVTKPTVDPYFSPIATSPTSPGSLAGAHFYVNPTHPRSPDKPLSSRSNSERSVRSAQGDALPLPSPLRMSDGKEYFPEVKLGASLSSGFVIQSPDGQSAGIFFHPRSKASQSPTSSERYEGQLLAPPVHMAPSPRQRPDDSIQNTTAISSTLAVPTPPKQPPLGSDNQGQESESNGRRPTADKPPSSPLQVSSPIVRKPSPLDSITATSPVVEVASPPTIYQRRPTPKRPSSDKSSSFPTVVGKNGKGPRDANVVPPISVLIVDGA
jgi:osomolarity two-component system response regulator SSK1